MSHSDSQLLIRRTADMARKNSEAITTLQDVVHDQRLLIENLTLRIEELEPEQTAKYTVMP